MTTDMKRLLTLLALVVLTTTAYAGSATWNLNPINGDWNNAANWTPATVPNGPDDVATFTGSNTTIVSLSAATEVNSIVFNAGANAFRIKAPTQAASLTISGNGIVNNSTITQTFRALGQGMISFTNSATAGNQTFFQTGDEDSIGIIAFYGKSNAGAATSRTQINRALISSNFTTHLARPMRILSLLSREALSLRTRLLRITRGSRC
jgi:hypothetical protein